MLRWVNSDDPISELTRVQRKVFSGMLFFRKRKKALFFFVQRRYLLGLLHKENPVGPGLHIEPDQPVDIVKKMIPYNGRVGEAHGERMHSLVEIAFHEQQRMLSKQVGYGARVATLKQLSFVLQYEPVHLRVGRENGRFAEHMGRENGTETFHSLVNERLRILRLVGGDQLQGLTYKGETQVSRRQSESPVPGSSEKIEEGDGTDR